jgi:adenosylhomocysteine nucleosidase
MEERRAPRTLVLVAFPPEWSALAPHVEDAEERQVLGRTVLAGTLSGARVLLAETGVSMVNAAMTTQALIDRFPIARIIVSGVAGGLDPALPVGSVLAPAAWGQFLEVGMGRAGAAGYTLPSLPGETDLPPFGMMIPRDVLVGGEARRTLPVDADLLRVAQRAAADPTLDLRVGGVGVSGSAFVDHADYRRYLHATFGASVVDMESAAVVQVANANGVPCIVFRALSDLAGGEVEANALPTSLGAACASAARVVLAYLAVLTKVQASSLNS